jgi:alkylation response protein AidB-like acyl-CoA dehydrogenase
VYVTSSNTPSLSTPPSNVGVATRTVTSLGCSGNPAQTRRRRAKRGRARADAAACVLYASEQAMVQAHQAVQAMGGAGFMNDSAVSRLFRDAKLMEIGAGTSEIRRMLVGRELMASMG